MEMYFDIGKGNKLLHEGFELIPVLVHGNEAMKINKPLKTLEEAFAMKEGFDFGTYIKNSEGFKGSYEKVIEREKGEDARTPT